MKEKQKKISIILIIFSIIILFIIISVFLLNRNTHNFVSNISDLSEAYDVKTCTEKFYIYCKEYINSNPNAVFELLDYDYIKYYNLDENTFKQKLGVIDSDKLCIKEVYKIQQRGSISLYIIKAYELYKNSDQNKNFDILLKLDKTNNTFSIFLDDYIIDNNYNNLNLDDRVNIKLKNIKVKENNTYDSHESIIINNIEDVFSDFRELCTFYEEYAYILIENECKQSKFTNYQLFDSYIINNFRDIITMKLVSFESIKRDGYIEYRCTSNKGHVYIFKVTSYITYTVTIE